MFHPVNRTSQTPGPMLEPSHAARVSRSWLFTPRFAAALSLAGGLGVLACSLSDDFEPRSVDVPQEVVAQVNSSPMGCDELS